MAQRSLLPLNVAQHVGQVNMLDRVIAYVSPAMGAKRLAARGMYSALGGGYQGARVDRAQLSGWNPGAGSPNADIIGDLPQLRSYSRDLGRNAPIVVGANNTALANIVGTGLTCGPAIDAETLGMGEEAARAWNKTAKTRFHTWASSADADLGRRLNFYAQQKLAKRSWFESGDTFVLTPIVAREDGVGRLALQLIEADRVCNPDRGQDTDELVDGIELNPATNEAVACHVARRHPGERYGRVNSWTRVTMRGSNGRRNVLHLCDPVRIGQVRGVPWTAPIIEPLKQLARYTDAELKAAVDSALITYFAKMDPDAFDDVFEDDEQAVYMESAAASRSRPMESGRVVNLLPGEEIQNNTPGRPNPQFDPFVQGILRQIGMALEIPYEVLVMHFQSSYSAARGALLMAWKFFRSQRDMLVTQLCQPVYELWLENEIATGVMAAPGFFASPHIRAAYCNAVWTGDGPGSIDPEKEVNAAQARVDMGISTLEAESILHDGVDWETKQAQRAREVARQKTDGTWMPKGGGNTGTQQQPNTKPAKPEPAPAGL